MKIALDVSLLFILLSDVRS